MIRKSILAAALVLAISAALLTGCSGAEPSINDAIPPVEHLAPDSAGSETITEPDSPLAPEPSPSDELRSVAVEIWNLSNAERAKAGLEPFQWNETLYQAACERAGELPVKFGHARPDGSEFWSVLVEHELAFSSAGENIAMGHDSAAKIVEAWMNSPGHKANILGNFKALAPAVVKCPDDSKYRGYASVQLFYTPQSQ